MNRTVLITVALVLTVTLAGCSTDPGTSTTTDAETTTATGLDLPETLTESELNQTHTQNLRDAGSFVTKYDVTVAMNTSAMNTEMQMSRTTKVDFTDGQYLKTQSGGFLSQGSTTFTNASVTYKKTEPSGEGNASYEKATPPYENSYLGPSPVNTTKAMQLMSFGSSTDATIKFKKVGITTLDGERVAEYRLTEASQQAVADAFQNETGSSALGGGGNYTLENSTVVLYVNADQTVRKFKMDFTFSSDSGQFSMALTQEWTAIGQTNVTKPDWVQTAAQQATEDTSDGLFNDSKESCTFLNTDVETMSTTNDNGSTTVTINVEDMGDAQNLTVEADGTVLTTIEATGKTTVTVPADSDAYMLTIYGHTSDGCKDVVTYASLD